MGRKTNCGKRGRFAFRGVGNALTDWIYFWKLRNRYRGRRGFIVGNGPSLRMEDLDRLTNEVSIASNRIYLAFQDVKWRPTLYTNVSTLQLPKYIDEIAEHFDTVHTFRFNRQHVRGCRARCWGNRGRISVPPDESTTFSGDLRAGCYGGFTVTFANLQLAVHLGCNPIYLIGCDHSYQDQPEHVPPNSVLHASGRQDHFVAHYRSRNETINPASIEFMDLAYGHARRYAQRNGITIKNATRGGHLEVFERVDLDSILK